MENEKSNITAKVMREALLRERWYTNVDKDKELAQLRRVATESPKMTTELVPDLRLKLKEAETQLLHMIMVECDQKLQANQLGAWVTTLLDALRRQELRSVDATGASKRKIARNDEKGKSAPKSYHCGGVKELQQ